MCWLEFKMKTELIPSVDEAKGENQRWQLKCPYWLHNKNALWIKPLWFSKHLIKSKNDSDAAQKKKSSPPSDSR